MMARAIRSLNDEVNVNSVNLLLSILIRYPQISTIKFLEQDRTFRFTFMFKPEEGLKLDTISTTIKKSLLAHCQLLGDEPGCCQVEFKDFSHYGSLEVKRDLASLSSAEISLLINLVRDALGPRLIAESPEPIQDDETGFQDEVISALLEDLREFPKGHTLYGMRENGHVLVFNHQDVDLRR